MKTKHILRILGLLLIFVSFIYASYLTFLLHQVIENVKEDSLLEVSRFFLSLYIWFKASLAITIGTILWAIGVYKNPKVPQYEKKLIMYLIPLFVFAIVFVLFFVFGR